MIESLNSFLRCFKNSSTYKSAWVPATLYFFVIATIRAPGTHNVCYNKKYKVEPLSSTFITRNYLQKEECRRWYCSLTNTTNITTTITK